MTTWTPAQEFVAALVMTGTVIFLVGVGVLAFFTFGPLILLAPMGAVGALLVQAGFVGLLRKSR